MKSIIASIRLVAATMLVCAGAYTLLILGIGRVIAPQTAQGSLVKSPDGKILGSRLIAQKFTKPHYFWSRPSACDYNGAGACGSNKSPTNPDVTERARKTAEEHGASSDKPLPAELAAASGGGLDPHITEHAALYQAGRVAEARGMPRFKIEALIKERSFSPGGYFTPAKLVNVLELNLALDSLAAERQ